MPPSAVGYVVFDHPEDMSHGWAARSDDKRARLISGTHDLPSDTVWIFNSEWDAMYDQQVHHNAIYRNCRYFGPSLPRVLRDLGIPDNAAQEQSLVGARIAGRVLSLYHAVFGGDHIPPNRLALAIRERIAAPDSAIHPTLDQALTDSSEMFDWVRDPSGSAEEGRDVVLRLHPLTYSQTLLSAIIPDDGADPVWDDAPPAQPTMDWLTANAPLLARLTVQSQDRIVALLINFGATGDQGSQRRFVTHYELSRLVASQVKIQVHQVVKWAPSTVKFQSLLRLTNQLLQADDGLFLASESVTLFADVLWRAAATRLPPAHARRQTAHRYRSLAAPFMHALGRISCANVALDLIQEGLLVRRQGYGQIGVLMRSGDDWHQLADLCIVHKLLPPVFPKECALPNYNPPEGYDPQDPLVLAISLRARGTVQPLLQIDEAITDRALLSLRSLG